MAFTSRAERETLAKGLASTPATVGPGSYGTYFNQVCPRMTHYPMHSVVMQDEDAGLDLPVGGVGECH